MIRKFLPIVQGDRVNQAVKWLERFNHGSAYQLSSLVLNFEQFCIPAFPLHQGDDRLLVPSSYDRIALPVPDLKPQINHGRALVNRASIGDLAPSLPAASVTLSSFLLAAQMHEQLTSTLLIRIDMAVDRFMANVHGASNLLWTPFLSHQVKGRLKRINTDLFGISASQGPDLGFQGGLLWSVPFKARVSLNLSRNGGLASTQSQGNLSLIKSSFHKGKNLISFVLAEMVIFHGNLTGRSRSYGY